MVRLAQVERDRDVRILFAVESGSRAWGIWSPDSDYDVRFVYVQKPDWYLSIHENRRDVIETPLDAIFDVGGWELAKALRLMIKPNAVVHEWLCSPIIYRQVEDVTAQLADFARQVFALKSYAHHYVHLGRNQWRTFLEAREVVTYKKYLYAIRPALVLSWLAQHPGTLPPMNVQELIGGLMLDTAIVAEINALIDKKKSLSELGQGPRLPVLDHFVEQAFADGLATAEKMLPRSQHLWDAGDALFRDILHRVWHDESGMFPHVLGYRSTPI